MIKLSTTDLIQNYSSLFQSVVKWAEDRNFFDPANGVTADSQILNLVEELGEMSGAWARGKEVEFQDGLGDAQVVLIIMMRLHYQEELKDVSDAPKKILDLCAKMCMTIESHLSKKEEEMTSNGMDMTIELLRSSLHYISSANYAAAFGNLVFIEQIRSDYKKLGFALNMAYETIKDRKGQFINRVFVKEDDFKKKKDAKNDAPLITEKKESKFSK